MATNDQLHAWMTAQYNVLCAAVTNLKKNAASFIDQAKRLEAMAKEKTAMANDMDKVIQRNWGPHGNQK